MEDSVKNMLDSIFFTHKFVTKHKLEIAHEKLLLRISHGSAFAKNSFGMKGLE